MSRGGYFGLGHPHEEPDDDEEAAKAGPGAEVMCKHCGQGPFTWVHSGVRWRLVGERGRIHQCAGAPGTADDFD